MIKVTDENVEQLKELIQQYEESKKEPKCMEDVWEILSERMGERQYFLSGDGEVEPSFLSINDIAGFPSDKRPLQLQALSMIMQVADALNREDCYVGKGAILFSKTPQSDIDLGCIVFKEQAMLEKARYILGNGDKEKGDIVIRTACGIFND